LRVNLIPLEIHDFNVILGINWLSTYHANIHCHTKMVSFRTPNGKKKVEFKGERNKVYEGLLSILAARKLVRKGVKFTLFMLSHPDITTTD
jgi:hypothetical protein